MPTSLRSGLCLCAPAARAQIDIVDGEAMAAGATSAITISFKAVTDAEERHSHYACALSRLSRRAPGVALRAGERQAMP